MSANLMDDNVPTMQDLENDTDDRISRLMLSLADGETIASRVERVRVALATERAARPALDEEAIERRFVERVIEPSLSR